jgi:hypothetical protein
MNGFPELLRRLVDALDGAKVPFMIAGSFASTAHGLPRATQDLDVVIDPPDEMSLRATRSGPAGDPWIGRRATEHHPQTSRSR